MQEPEQGNFAQHRKDQETYVAWKKKNSLACITLLSCMQDDLLIEYKVYKIAHEMQKALKEKYGGLSATKMRELVMKFGNYKI